MSWIETYSGKRLSLTHPAPEDIEIEDIARGLSNLCRYTGQISRFYSVAEHSVLVAQLLKSQGHELPTIIGGLLHDATEAFIGDVTSPLKRLLPDYRNVENRLESAVFERFFSVLEGFDAAAIKAADLELLHIEAYEIYGEARASMWSSLPPGPPKNPHLIMPVFFAPHLAHDCFIAAWKSLSVGNLGVI